jgi:molecular chaperone Hsp33
MASAIDSSDTVYTAQSLHGLSATASAALGRLLTGASMMGAMLKQEHASLTLRIDGGGPLGVLTAISDSRGNVRGCVDNPRRRVPKKPNGKLDVRRRRRPGWPSRCHPQLRHGRAVYGAGRACQRRDR